MSKGLDFVGGARRSGVVDVHIYTCMHMVTVNMLHLPLTIC